MDQAMDHKMKVIHVIGGGEFGGAEQHIIQILALMPQHGVQGKVICFYEAGLSKALREQGVDVEVLEYGRFDFRLIFGLRKLFLREQPDIIHTHGVKANFFARIAAKPIPSIPLVTTVHSLLRYDYIQRLAYFVASSMEKFTRSMNNHYIAVSHAIKESLVKEGIAPEEITIVHHGIDAERYAAAPMTFAPDGTPQPEGAAPTAPREEGEESADGGDAARGDGMDAAHNVTHQDGLRTELALPQDAYVIGVVTRLVTIKGMDFMINAMPRILEHNPKARLIIAGTGPQEQELKQQAEEIGLTGAVYFIGFREDVEDCLRSFDCFVSASLSEGLGLNVLEAMAASIPVVATGVGGILDFMKDRENGLLVNPGSSKVLSDAIIEMMGNPELAEKLAEEARRMVKQQFSLQNMSDRTVAVYEKLLNGSSEDRNV